MIIKLSPMGAVRMTQRSKWQPNAQKYLAWKGEFKRLSGDYESTGEMYIAFHVPMPATWSKKKKAAHVGHPCLSKPDLDNCIKSVFDALLVEDKAIHGITAKKVWSYEGAIEIL